MGPSEKAGQAEPGAGKLADLEVLFGGDCDDHFRLSIKVTRYAAEQVRCSRPDLQRFASGQTQNGIPDIKETPSFWHNAAGEELQC